MVEEVKTYHRWFGIIFYHSPYFSRVMRITSVGTNVIIVLFVQALTYNITDPNDGSCEKEKTMNGCLKDHSPSDSSEPKCVWNESTSKCSFNDVNESIVNVISIAVLCSLLSAPLALFVQLIITKILTVPTLNESKSNESTNTTNSTTNVTPTSIGHISRTVTTIIRSLNRIGMNGKNKNENELSSSDLLSSYRELLGEIREFRKCLTQKELNEFDGKSFSIK